MSSEEVSEDENYNRRRWRTREFNKEDAMLGIFNDREEEYVPDNNVLQPLAFVPAKSKVEKSDEENMEEEEVEDEEIMDEDEAEIEEDGEEEILDEGLDDYEQEGNPGFGLGFNNSFRSISLGGSVSRRSKVKKSSLRAKKENIKAQTVEIETKAEPPKYEPVTLTANDKKKVGTFLTGSIKDKILNMMAKSGYKPGQGLGVQKQGIVNPITATGQTVKEGLGYGNYESPASKNKSKNKKLTDDEDSEDEEDPNSISIVSKPRKIKRPKVVYRAFNDLENKIIGGLADGPIKQKIVDMTGTEPRQLDSLDQIEGNQSTVNIRTDIRLLIDLLYDDIARLESEVKTNATQRHHNQLDRDSLLPFTQVGDLEQTRLESLEAIVPNLQETSLLAISDNSVKLEVFEGPLKDLEDRATLYLQDAKQDTSVVFLIDRVAELATATVAPAIQLALQDWDLTQSPTLLVQFFKKWPHLFFPIHLAPTAQFTGEVGNEGYISDDFTPFDKLISTTWLPQLRSFLVNQWDPNHYEPVLQLIHEWTPILHPSTLTNILDQLVIPKLKQAIINWDFKSDPISPHIYLHPWLPVLQDKFDFLIPEMQTQLYQLVKSYDILNPKFDLIHTYIAPWYKIISSKSLDKILTKGLIPNLQRVLRHVEIDPSQQDLDLLNKVLEFHKVLPPTPFAEFLAETLKPKWLFILEQWLQLEPPLNEVVAWYRFWKSLLPEELFTEQMCKEWFLEGLVNINLYLDNKLN